MKFDDEEEKKKLIYPADGDQTDAEGNPRQSIEDANLGDMSKTSGIAPIDAPKKYDNAGNEIAPSDKDKQQFVRFFDDRTDPPRYSNNELMAMAAIGMLTPLLGGALGGRQGAMAGGASAAKGIGDFLEKDADAARKVREAKAINKSKVVTARALNALNVDSKGVGGKVKFEWLQSMNEKGEPIFVRADRVTGETDRTLDLPAYTAEYYKNFSPKAGSATDKGGIVMPPPSAPSKIPPGQERRDDSTFNYDGGKRDKKPTDVPGKLPSSTTTAKQDAQSAETMAQSFLSEIDAQMPASTDLDPTPKDGESINAARTRAETAKELRQKLIDKQTTIREGLIGAQKDMEKEARGEERAKRLLKFRSTLEKQTGQSKRQVMRNAKGQLVDVVTKEIVDSNENAPKPPPGTNPAQANKQADKIVQFDTAIADMQDVLNKVGEHSNWVGVIDGRAPAVDPNEAVFRSSLGQMVDSYRHAITGAGAGNAELQKLESRLPAPTDVSLKVFRAKAVDYIQKMQRAKEVYLKDHKVGPDVSAIKENADVQKAQTAPNPGMVLFQAPDGAQAWIPKERLDYYMKKSDGKGKVVGGN